MAEYTATTDIDTEIKNRDPAFTILQVDSDKGTVTVEINKGVLGSMANHLKTIQDWRKGSRVIRQLGYKLAHAGNVLYEQKEEQEVKAEENISVRE